MAARRLAEGKGSRFEREAHTHVLRNAPYVALDGMNPA
jgi:hypothetical protein